MTLTIGSLFSGIGGLELGLERAGLGPVVFQVEKDAYCRAVLAKHWPDATRYEDVKDVGGRNLVPVDVLCGGFPCQPHSIAGKQRGTSDDRYLWPEFARIIRDLRPAYVVVENVSNILADGTAFRVLGELAALGYDAEWSTVSACAVGAPHMRERLFVVAYDDRPRRSLVQGRGQVTECARHRTAISRSIATGEHHGWSAEPNVGRVAHGVPSRVDRLRALGNAVVPQVAEVVGRVIVERERALSGAA